MNWIWNICIFPLKVKYVYVLERRFSVIDILCFVTDLSIGNVIHVYFKVGFNKEAVFLYRNQGIKIFSSICLLVEKKLLTVSHYSI